MNLLSVTLIVSEQDSSVPNRRDDGRNRRFIEVV